MAGEAGELNAPDRTFVHLLFLSGKGGVQRPSSVGARPQDPPSRQAAIACFTASTSCLRLKGFGRKLNASPSGRFFWNASSA